MANESILTRLRRQVKLKQPGMDKILPDVTAKQGWTAADGGTDERIRRLSQVEVASERNRPLKRRVLAIAAILVILHTFVIRSALQAQLQRWIDQPDAIIALTGTEGSAVVPFLFTFWYAIVCLFLTRCMASRQPAEPVIFEIMVLYNFLQAAMSGYVFVSVCQQVNILGLNFVGNPAPVMGASHHRLGILAILHYYLRILEMTDTFFLIMRKKTGRSLVLHVILRLQNLWGWHIACRFGCGGDIYFLIAVVAIGSTILHVHYVVALLEPRVGQLCWPFSWLLLGQRSSFRRTFVMTVQVWMIRVCLVYQLLSFYAGAYPRIVIVLQIVQLLFGNALFSNFHYEVTEARATPISDEADAGKLSFSFDSSGWGYLYHFGVALWIQDHFEAEIASGEFQFSGSSGGAIVAVALAAKTDLPPVIDSILRKTWPLARLKPWLLPGEIQDTLEAYFPKNSHTLATNHVRILTTRLLPKPPFVMAEVFGKFKSRQQLFDVLAASSHMPFIFGLGFRMGSGLYFDGLLWPSSLVPWRSFAPSQRVCRVSAFSAVGSDIGPRWIAMPPFWWLLLPPSQEALEGLMWAGYRDIAAIFGTGDFRSSQCGPCARRQPHSCVPRKTHLSSERIDELIRVYERTAQRHWAIVLGFSFALTFSLTSFWLYSIATN